jgi:predicted adenine nucleotide alpha hydrolase (AANH) superfamily ATPase
LTQNGRLYIINHEKTQGFFRKRRLLPFLEGCVTWRDHNVKRLLLHICCAPDATVGVERLSPDYDVTLLFHNPNIYPAEEYHKRFDAAKQLTGTLGIGLIEGDYDTEAWLDAVRGLEDEPEKGRRCETCFKERLRTTARIAREKGFDVFAAVLTVSPHKDAALINRLGARAAEEYGVEYLPTDLKKKDGFKRSVELSRLHGLYRQDYCGCEFSLRKKSGAGSQEPE